MIVEHDLKSRELAERLITEVAGGSVVVSMLIDRYSERMSYRALGHKYQVHASTAMRRIKTATYRLGRAGVKMRAAQKY